MYALDTNLLVHAHNLNSASHTAAKTFVETAINQRDDAGNFSICIPAQVLVELLNVITWSRLEAPLPLADALHVVQSYIDSGTPILYPQNSQMDTFLNLMAQITTRKSIFDVALAATLKDHNIKGLYTVNTKDFAAFSFLHVLNPLEEK